MGQLVQFTGPRRVEVVSYEPGPLPPGHLRVRTRYSGISAGTELTAYRGTNPYITRMWNPSGRLFANGGAGMNYPVAGWGYSEVGTVMEAAEDVADVAALPKPGDVVWGIWGHRSEAVVPADRLRGHVIPAGLDPLAAAFARVGAIALNAVLAADIHLGEWVAVFGQGVIGLVVTRLATLSGGEVVAVDPLPPRLARAQLCGARAVLDARIDGVAEQIRKISGDMGADVAIEISGAYPALHEAIRSVVVSGRVVAAGFYQGDGLGLRLGEEFHHNRIQLVCSQIGDLPPQLGRRWDTERLQRTFMRLLATDSVDVLSLVSHVVPAARAADAYQLIDEHPEQCLQVVLEFGQEPGEESDAEVGLSGTAAAR